MTFDSTWLRENPGKTRIVRLQDGSTAEVCWLPVRGGNYSIVGVRDGVTETWRDTGCYCRDMESHPRDIVSYAPETGERWVVRKQDGTFDERWFSEERPPQVPGISHTHVLIQYEIIKEEEIN